MAWRKRMVLIVDDDDEVRRLFREALEHAGYEVREARGGFEALHHVDINPPDVIVLDLIMPGVDGFAVRHQLATRAHTRHVPIVVVTGASDDLQSLDVACLLKKPISSDALVSAVRTCLASRAATR